MTCLLILVLAAMAFIAPMPTAVFVLLLLPAIRLLWAAAWFDRKAHIRKVMREHEKEEAVAWPDDSDEAR